MHEGKFNMHCTDIIATYIRNIIDTKCSRYNENTKKYELTKAGKYIHQMLQCTKDKYAPNIFLNLTRINECYYGSSEAYESDYERVIGAIMLILINSNPFISTMLKLSEEESKVNA